VWPAGGRDAGPSPAELSETPVFSPKLKCLYCGSDLPHRSVDDVEAVRVCPHCRSSSTFAELIAAEEARLAREVDGALSRVRAVRRRFPNR
jgi:hypothetical protein